MILLFNLLCILLGESADQYSQDVVTDALFSSLVQPIPHVTTLSAHKTLKTYSPQAEPEITHTETFQEVRGFLFSSRLTSDGIWQVSE